MKDIEKLIAEARRLEGDYGDPYEVMSHMSELADALEATLGEPEPEHYHIWSELPCKGDCAEPPTCSDHRLVQHRDGKPPWCRACGRASSHQNIGG